MHPLSDGRAGAALGARLVPFASIFFRHPIRRALSLSAPIPIRKLETDAIA
jgi:hypothetical protein